MTIAILIYLLAVNAVTFIAYGLDKYKAKHAKWRISEATLLLLAVVGGSIGAWCGMKVWHHKTMHKKFKYGVPVILFLQLALAVWIVCKIAQTPMPIKTTIEKIDHLTDSLKDELIDVWDKSVRSSHHFLSKEDLDYYRPRIRDIYFDAVDLYVIRNPKVSAFMGLSEDMVEMLFVLPSEKGKGYGSALLNFAFGEKHICKIDVNEQNTEAYQFYINRGYHAIARDEVDAEGKPYPIIHLER